MKSERKILVEIAACKLVEGFFILLAANFLVTFINAPAEKILLATFGFFAGRFIIASRAEIFFARLSVNVQTTFRKSIHEKIFIKYTNSGELLTLIFDTVQSLDEFFLKVAPQIASTIIFLPMFIICAAVTDLLTAGILMTVGSDFRAILRI